MVVTRRHCGRRISLLLLLLLLGEAAAAAILRHRGGGRCGRWHGGDLATTNRLMRGGLHKSEPAVVDGRLLVLMLLLLLRVRQGGLIVGGRIDDAQGIVCPIGVATAVSVGAFSATAGGGANPPSSSAPPPSNLRICSRFS